MRKKETTAGFTLIEIVVVIVVAAIILPVIILPFYEGVRELDTPVERGTMAFLAQEEMEKKIVAFSYQSVVGWGSVAIPGFADYNSSCTVDDSAAFGAVTDGVKEVTVTVSKGDESFSLVTVKTDWE